ncbi:MAG: SGNH/GDSL hydrolase family protein [bacterium]
MSTLNITRKFSGKYQLAATALLNLVVAFVLINLGLYAVFFVKDFFSGSNPVYKKYGQSLTYEKVYPHLTREERNRLLKETWENRPYAFEPFTQFKERAFKGKYVNVDRQGFRLSRNQGAWPPDRQYFNLFVLGGSTTFGYGVADDQTIPSYLQEILNKTGAAGKKVKVYNFGRAAYYSSLERLLWEKLLVTGPVPDMVLFIDGMNDFYFHEDLPHFSREIKKTVEGTGPVAHPVLEILNKLPIGRAAGILKNVIVSSEKNRSKTGRIVYNDKVKKVCRRYFENKKIIEAVSRAYGVRPVFVWQPVPTYKYDLKYHLFAGAGDFLGHNYSKFGYPLMADLARKKPLGKNFFWLADFQEDLREPLYVDQIHYRASMNRMLADKICQMLSAGNFFIRSIHE